jgi:hypothetical protein
MLCGAVSDVIVNGGAEEMIEENSIEENRAV